ncbi:hypothetical protein VNO78_30544 [Psophocarpus tetragonolobus]|uniref:Uncharacterized protein n=1 Tax=Psophocarpus tetragonolobus TaxID=3891 RepID=A0AAN9X6V6_PSOTE
MSTESFGAVVGESIREMSKLDPDFLIGIVGALNAVVGTTIVFTEGIIHMLPSSGLINAAGLVDGTVYHLRRTCLLCDPPSGFIGGPP